MSPDSPSKHVKPAFVEIYAWNEPVLSTTAIVWGVYLAILPLSDVHFGVRMFIGIWVALWGLLLLLVQSSTLRTFLDYTILSRIALYAPKSFRSHVLKTWPLSISIRVLSHFFFCWWWALCCVSVLYGIENLADSRFALYLGFSLLHFDRLVRIIQWMRK